MFGYFQLSPADTVLVVKSRSMTDEYFDFFSNYAGVPPKLS